MNAVDLANSIISLHNYKICMLCQSASKDTRACTEYCLPVEMFVKLLEEKEPSGIMHMLSNAEGWFKDED